MDTYEELISWATEQGIKINGIKPQNIPNRGTGIIATRNIQAGETILFVPFKLFRTLNHIPKPISRRLPRNSTLHALLATHLTLDKTPTYAIPNKTLPSLSSFEPGMPLLWPAPLQLLLPKPALDLLTKQQRSFHRDWAAVSNAYPDISRDAYLHAWLLVNTRSFYCETPRMQRLPHDDRLAILPVADLFNHADVGCEARLAAEHYAFVADRDYADAEELHISYGSHSTDFLLAEYGFVPQANRWDVVCLDDVILPRLTDDQRGALKDRGFLGKYVLEPRTRGCFRTQVALRMLCCSREEWERFVDFEGGEEFAIRVEGKLGELLHVFVGVVRARVREVEACGVGSAEQKGALVRRWRQIEKIVLETMDGLGS